MAGKQLKEEWIEAFSREFKAELDPAGTEEVLKEMLRRGIANRVRVLDYLLVRDYPRFLARNKGEIMDTLYQLADKYEISERHVQRIIYKWRSIRKE